MKSAGIDVLAPWDFKAFEFSGEARRGVSGECDRENPGRIRVFL
jgi:hypothetical protein